MTTELKREHITLRLERELREQIQMAAAADRRPISSLIRNVLADWIDGRQSAESAASN